MIKKVSINTDYIEDFLIPTLDSCIKYVTDAYNGINLSQIPKDYLYYSSLEKEKEKLYIHKNNLITIKNSLLNSIKKSNVLDNEIINDIKSIRHFVINQKK